jgi:ankyrin repeat protein
MRARFNSLKCSILAVPLILFLPCLTQAQTNKPQEPACFDPLLRAIHDGNESEIDKIIASKPDLDKKSCSDGATPLTKAIGLGLPDIAKKLILAGARPNVVADGSGSSPLMGSAWGCSEDLVVMLLDRGANVNLTDSDGYSALMFSAAKCMDGRIVALLIRAGAQVNQGSKTGRTALIDAAGRGNEVVVMELIAAGADLDAKTARGETALTAARDLEVGRKPSHDRIYELLRQVTKIGQDRGTVDHP